MKLTLFFLLAALVHVSASVYSQQTKLSISMKDVTVKEVLKQIEDQSEFFFLYKNVNIDVNRIVSVDMKDKSVESLLDQIFSGTTVSYEVVNRQIVLIDNGKANSFSQNEQQQKSISGKVTDSSRSSLPGVTVMVKGTTNGTITDSNGNYSISNIPANATLQFSFVGMKAQEVSVGTQSTITVVLAEETVGIEEVVAVGYGTQKKINLTGAVSNVTSQVLESRPITNLGQGLQGAISNLNITPGSGALGQGATFNIRGITSINGGGPLILVNGVPMDVNLVNPLDIESVSVLKDAASAAIYGARAAYGVILITTKSGKRNNKPTVSLSMNYSINKPVVKIEMMDVMERMIYMNLGNIRSSGQVWGEFDQYGFAAISAHYNDPSQPELFTHPSNPSVWSPCANTDWARELMRDSYPMQQYTASVSGGSDKSEYYTSFSYFNQEGMARHFNERYNRYNFTTNLNYDIAKWFKVGTKISINSSDKKYPPNDSQDNFNESYAPFQKYGIPSVPIYTPDGNWYQYGSIPNVVQMQEEGGYRTRDISDSWLTGTVKLTPVKNMTFNMDYSFNIKDTKELSYWKLLPKYDKAGLVGYYPFTNPSSVARYDFGTKYRVFNAYADYENTFNKKHYFKAMVGFNQENYSNSSLGAERRNLIIEEIPYESLATGQQYTVDAISQYAIRGAFSRLNYSFTDRYLFEFNCRYDGTSKFPKKDRFAFFPSVSLGWRIDNETFFSGLKNSINMLKLRSSYGNLGNQNVDYYPYISTSSTGLINYLINGVKPMTVYTPGLVSASLTWETVTQKDFGVDFAVLDSRLTGSFDIFRRDTKNMLTKSQTLPAVLGVNEPQANAADLKTTGFDLTLGWKHSFHNFKYGITFLLSDNTSEITKFSNPSGTISDYYVGKKLGEIWGLETGGLFQTDAEAVALDQTKIDGRKRTAGDIWFVDLDGDGKITKGDQTLANHGDMKIIGNNTPHYSFGFKTDVSWKGFDLDIFLQGVAKRDVVLDNRYYLEEWYNPHWSPLFKLGLDYWTPENRNALYPAPWVGIAKDVVEPQTRFLQNGAYIRLKQLTLGYSIPSNMTNKMGVQRIRVYFSGTNLWEMTKMIEISDPEEAGSRYYPLSRSISFGADINF